MLPLQSGYSEIHVNDLTADVAGWMQSIAHKLHNATSTGGGVLASGSVMELSTPCREPSIEGYITQMKNPLLLLPWSRFYFGSTYSIFIQLSLL